MKKIIFASFVACIMFIVSLGCAHSADKTIINLNIDADIPAMASDDQGREASDLLHAMGQQLTAKGIVATFYATQDLIRTPARLRMTALGRENFELAMSGNSSNEKISTESYSEQKAILQTSKDYVTACRVCGVNEIAVSGFMPQSFDQNEDTYKVLDELGIEYDTGFQAGVIFAPGHDADVWPYKMEGHKFYAVPVSTYNLSGKKVPLQDRYFNENDLTSDQWYNALVDKFNEIQGKDEPMVIILTRSISGSGDYFEIFKKFLDFATSKGATFVTTKDLVNMSRNEEYVPPAKASEKCATCDKDKEESVGLSIEATNATENATS
jgi:hypothetical protein